MSRGVAGKRYPAIEMRLDPDHVRAFAEAIGADPAAGVPPTYAAVYALFATAAQLFGDDEADVDFSHLLHSEQEFRWEHHPEPGDRVTATGSVQADFDRRGMRFVTFVSEVVGEDGGAVCSSTMVDVIRS